MCGAGEEAMHVHNVARGRCAGIPTRQAVVGAAARQELARPLPRCTGTIESPSHTSTTCHLQRVRVRVADVDVEEDLRHRRPIDHVICISARTRPWRTERWVLPRSYLRRHRQLLCPVLTLLCVTVQCRPRAACVATLRACAVALAVCVQLPAACEHGRVSPRVVVAGPARGPHPRAIRQCLGLRGGSSTPGYTGLPDEELLDEPRSAQELWDTVYSRPGAIALCNLAGFDTAIVGEHSVIEGGGAHTRNFEYGYRCCCGACPRACTGVAQNAPWHACPANVPPHRACAPHADAVLPGQMHWSAVAHGQQQWPAT